MSKETRKVKSVSFEVSNPTYPYLEKHIEIIYNSDDLSNEFVVDQDIRELFNTHDDYILDEETVQYTNYEELKLEAKKKLKLTLSDWIHDFMDSDKRSLSLLNYDSEDDIKVLLYKESGALVVWTYIDILGKIVFQPNAFQLATKNWVEDNE